MILSCPLIKVKQWCCSFWTCLLHLIQLTIMFFFVDWKNIFGLSGKVLEWFRSYLKERSQRVSDQRTSSNVLSLFCGISQGSVLGPLIFTLYTPPLGITARRVGVGHHFYTDFGNKIDIIYLSSSLVLWETSQLSLIHFPTWMIMWQWCAVQPVTISRISAA